MTNAQGWCLIGVFRLPPTLNRYIRHPISSCSKASRGLFVQPWEKSIFTPLAISPGTLLRQLFCCYAVRAGRNSPDKEFRYLRTVIVTAGVHQRFSSKPFRLHTRCAMCYGATGQFFSANQLCCAEAFVKRMRRRINSSL